MIPQRVINAVRSPIASQNKMEMKIRRLYYRADKRTGGWFIA